MKTNWSNFCSFCIIDQIRFKIFVRCTHFVLTFCKHLLVMYLFCTLFLVVKVINQYSFLCAIVHYIWFILVLYSFCFRLVLVCTCLYLVYFCFVLIFTRLCSICFCRVLILLVLFSFCTHFRIWKMKTVCSHFVLIL